MNIALQRAEATAHASASGLLGDAQAFRHFLIGALIEDPKTDRVAYPWTEALEGVRESATLAFEICEFDEASRVVFAKRGLLESETFQSATLGSAAPVIERQLPVSDPVQPGRGLLGAAPAEAAPGREGLCVCLGP